MVVLTISNYIFERYTLINKLRVGKSGAIPIFLSDNDRSRKAKISNADHLIS